MTIAEYRRLPMSDQAELWELMTGDGQNVIRQQPESDAAGRVLDAAVARRVFGTNSSPVAKSDPTAYFIDTGEGTAGPFTAKQLRLMWEGGKLTLRARFRTDEAGEWQPIRAILDLLEESSPVKAPSGGASFANAVMPQNTATPAQRMVVSVRKSRGVYIVLALFFGLLGIHNFYAGYNSRGVIQLLITVLTGWFVIPLIVVGIWALLEACTVEAEANGETFG